MNSPDPEKHDELYRGESDLPADAVRDEKTFIDAEYDPAHDDPAYQEWR